MFKWLFGLSLIGAIVFGLFGALIGSTAAAGTMSGLPAPSAATAESRYLDRTTAILDDGMLAADDLGVLLDEAGDDIYVIFDADWQADLSETCDDFDAVYATAKKLKAPASYKTHRKYFVASYKQMHLACDDLRRFVTDYDAEYLSDANDHMTKAGDYMERATEEITGMTLDDTI